MPRHHLAGQTPPSVRPVFNTLDFQNDTPKQVAATCDDSKSADPFKHKKKKKTKRSSLGAAGGEQKDEIEKTSMTQSTSAMPIDTGSTKRKYTKRKEDPGIHDLNSSTKKLKGDSKTQAATPSAPGNNDPLLGTAFLQGLKDSMGDLSASFGQLGDNNRTSNATSKRRKRRSDRKSDVTNSTLNLNRGETAKSEQGRRSLDPDAVASLAMTPVPLPSAKSPQALTPIKTPIPLPQRSPSRLLVVPSESPLEQAKARLGASKVLVSETPSLQMFGTPIPDQKPPIPFSLSQMSKRTGSNRKKDKKGLTINISSPSTDGIQTPVPAPAHEIKAEKVINDGQTLFTSSNLLQYKQARNDDPRPCPRGRPSSVATSTVSSASSMSIKNAFTPPNKPYTRSGAEIDPFVVPEVKKKIYRETHDESDLATFTTCFNMAQNTVNFTDEHEYLDTYLTWHVENDFAGPLPCLNKATGCNAKREQVLRLSKENPSPMLAVTVTTSDDAAALEDAKQRCAEAEGFLMFAVAARVPVPLGRLEGVWKLFCPKYSDTHVDKYGFGQRTLSISSIAGSKRSSTYTARVSIPPRSMAYTIQVFDAPPHASFRATTVKTSVEGYKMEIVFLGNGYLLFRADLQLLLLGKQAERKEGRTQWMEFVGTHERAVRWREEKDELEVEGKRLFARYDGSGE